MSSDKPETKIVKVQAFPIEMSLLKPEGGNPLKAYIVKLTNFGFMMQATGHFYRIGENYTANFTIPVYRQLFSEPVKVIKTYETIEAYIPGGTKEKVMTVEMHFRDLKKEKKDMIASFLKKVEKK
ncbi:MAG: hypothetical protein BroJett040_05410 [Oligoflexia bacterium]|nr:MAG: hypothetical protein BroJett040_05410 [Oligoflexia bacterium]